MTIHMDRHNVNENLYFQTHSATCKPENLCLEIKQFCLKDREAVAAFILNGGASSLCRFKSDNGAIYMTLPEMGRLILLLYEERYGRFRRYLQDAKDHLSCLAGEKGTLTSCERNIPANLINPVSIDSKDIDDLTGILKRVLIHSV